MCRPEAAARLLAGLAQGRLSGSRSSRWDFGSSRFPLCPGRWCRVNPMVRNPRGSSLWLPSLPVPDSGGCVGPSREKAPDLGERYRHPGLATVHRVDDVVEPVAVDTCPTVVKPQSPGSGSVHTKTNVSGRSGSGAGETRKRPLRSTSPRTRRSILDTSTAAIASTTMLTGTTPLVADHSLEVGRMQPPGPPTSPPKPPPPPLTTNRRSTLGLGDGLGTQAARDAKLGRGTHNLPTIRHPSRPCCRRGRTRAGTSRRLSGNSRLDMTTPPKRTLEAPGGAPTKGTIGAFA